MRRLLALVGLLAAGVACVPGNPLSLGCAVDYAIGLNPAGYVGLPVGDTLVVEASLYYCGGTKVTSSFVATPSDTLLIESWVGQAGYHVYVVGRAEGVAYVLVNSLSYETAPEKLTIAVLPAP